MNSIIRILFILVLLLYPLKFYALETDNFTDRSIPLADSTDFINSITNKSIEKAISSFEKKCDPDKNPADDADLIEHLQGVLDQNNPEPARLLFKQSPTKDYQPRAIDISTRKESPYYDIPRMTNFCCAPVVNIQKHYVGLDKYDHLFGMGLSYFWTARKSNAQTASGRIMESLKTGEVDERNGWGLEFTGVYSYGDLSANLAGLFFWSDLLGWNLKSNISIPSEHVTCNRFTRRYSLTNAIKIEKYINHAMDEGLNCSIFNEKIPNSGLAGSAFFYEGVGDGKKASHIRDNMKNNNLSCPASKDKCKTAVDETKQSFASRSLDVDMNSILKSTISQECSGLPGYEPIKPGGWEKTLNFLEGIKVIVTEGVPIAPKDAYKESKVR